MSMVSISGADALFANSPLAYLATPYTKYRPGIGLAFAHAAQLAAVLMRAGINIYSPIVHCHPIAIEGKIDPLDVDFWLANQAGMMRRSDVLIVAKMEGWDESRGVAHEIATFHGCGKPVFHCDPAGRRLWLSRPLDAARQGTA